MIKCLLLLSSLFRLIPSKQTSWIKPPGIPDGPQDFNTWSDQDIWSANDIQCIPSYHIVKCGEPHCGHTFHLKHLPRHYTKHHQITLKESSDLKYRVLYPSLSRELSWCDKTKKHEDKKQQRKKKEEQRRSAKRKKLELDKIWAKFLKKPKVFLSIYFVVLSFLCYPGTHYPGTLYSLSVHHFTNSEKLKTPKLLLL